MAVLVTAIYAATLRLCRRNKRDVPAWMAVTNTAMTGEGKSSNWKDLPSYFRQGIFSKMRGGWVYIVTNRINGTLYLGVTSNLSLRIWQHRTGAQPGFTKRYGLKRLVWYEPFSDIREAIQRERTMKHWSRAWKVRLILEMNEDWRDLYEELNN